MDIFPNKIKNVTWTCEPEQGSSCSATGEQAGNIDISVNINAGSYVTIRASGTIRNNASGNLVNTASINSPLQPEKNNQTAADTTTLVPLTDLAIDIISPDSAPPSTPITYTVVISNYGPSNASNIHFDFTLPEGATFLSSIPSSPQCTANPESLTCELGDLAVNSNIKVTIIIESPVSAGVITAQAAILANEDDPLLGNNSGSSEVLIE